MLDVDLALAEYVETIELSGLAVERATLVIEATKDLIEGDVTHLLVSDPSPPGAGHAFDSLIVFTDGFVYEYKNFLSVIDWDVTQLDGLVYATFTASHFDLKKAVAESVMTFSASFRATTIRMNWQGRGNNCNYGIQVVREVLAPYVHKGAPWETQ